MLLRRKHSKSGPEPKLLTPRTISSGLKPNIPYSTLNVPPTKNDWEILFQPMFNEYLNPPASVDLQVPIFIAIKPNVSTGTPSSTIIDQDAPPTSTSRTPPKTPSQVIPLSFEEADHDIEVAHMDNNPFVEFLIPEPSSKESSTQSYKDALIESYWIEAMQEELNKFKRLEVWEIVPCPDCVMVITLKWIYKVKLDELGGCVSCCFEFLVREEDLLTLEVPALKILSYRESKRRSNSCCDTAVVSAKRETFCSWGAEPELS
nr:Gag-Pol polyprotein [Tanacetum cinerariifolium]